jgi:hypothetical protein
LAISTNFEGLQVASRIALRATPIGHSDTLQLGAVAVGDLLKDLRVDAEVERRLIAAQATDASAGGDPTRYAASLPADAMEEHLRGQAETILQYSNNFRREGWDVPPGFRDAQEPLDRAMIQNAMRDLFESERQFVRADEDGEEVFTLSAIRVGPLAHD